VYQLRQAYSELKAGYTVTQSRIEKLESELEELWNIASKIPELRKKIGSDIYPNSCHKEREFSMIYIELSKADSLQQIFFNNSLYTAQKSPAS
jgi:hypothetical protein